MATEIVYDTSFVARANGDLSDMKPNSVLYKRISAISLSTTGKAKARYNRKLYQEYMDHIKELRNDFINVFITSLEKNGILIEKMTVEKIKWIKVKKLWPSHDRHLLAAALCDKNGCRDVGIYTSEKAHEPAGPILKREFKISLTVVV